MRVPFTYQAAQPWQYTVYAGNSTPSSGSSADGYYCKETVTGVRRKKPVGWREPTNYSFTRVCYSRAKGTVGYKTSSQDEVYSGCIGGTRWNSLNMFNSAFTWSTFPTSVSETALIKARLQMQDGEVNYGQAIAESNQTARLVGDSCKRLLTAVRALRRGDAKKVAKALSIGKTPPRKFVKKVQKTISAAKIQRLRKKETLAEAIRQDKSIRNMNNVTSAWLELQYGWKPLLQDIEGSISNLIGYDQYAWIMTGKGSSRRSTRIDKGIQNLYYSGFAAGYCSVTGIDVAKCIVIGIPSKTPPSILSDMGVTNLPLLAWEVTPFSFVVDWLLPVGDWLDSLDAVLGYDSLRTVSIEFSRYRWDEIGDMTCPRKATTYLSSFVGFKDYVRHVRKVTSGVPLPTRPSFKDPRSFGHMANGLALLSQIFGSKKVSVKY